jgi:ADP-heptose:LPS heptosyltransferase
VEWGGYWAPSLLIGLLFRAFGKRSENRSKTNPAILIVLMEHLGDIVVTSPLLRELRTCLPDASISVVVSRSGFPLIEHCPHLDRVIVAEPAETWWRQLRRVFALARSLRAFDIDVAIVPKDAHNTDFNELVCILAWCKRRLSRARPEPLYRIKPLKFRPCYDEILIDREARHEVESRLQFISRLGKRAQSCGLEAWLTPEELAYADRFLSAANVRSEVLVGFSIGASAAGRRWPLENFAKVIDRLAERLGTSALLIVSPDELDAARKLASLTSRPALFSAAATVRESMALLRHCALFIGNDSGPMHMAASVGVPVVEISCHPQGVSPRSISGPVRFGPYGVRHEVLQPPPVNERCARAGCLSILAPHCIELIAPATVLDAALRLLGAAFPNTAGPITAHSHAVGRGASAAASGAE